MIRMTLDRVGLTQSSVIRIIHRNVDMKCFLFTQMVVIIVRFSYICVSQGSAKTHFRCGGIYNYHIIANCPQSVPVKFFLHRSIIGKDMEKSKLPRFYGSRCIISDVSGP